MSDDDTLSRSVNIEMMHSRAEKNWFESSQVMAVLCKRCVKSGVKPAADQWACRAWIHGKRGENTMFDFLGIGRQKMSV